VACKIDKNHIHHTVEHCLLLLTFSCRSELPAAATSVGANSTRCSRMPTCTAQQQQQNHTLCSFSNHP
jgi:hypothetical protein